ncbi:MAG: helix-turn-helix domain-containing protein [Ilumatobacteraceae bacterium]
MYSLLMADASVESARPEAQWRPGAVPPLDVFKALGDNTRYAMYLELLVARRPLATAEVAERLGLHVNTVRPHLERLREVGLLEVEVDARGEVGRPQHRYSPASDAPAFGLKPPAQPVLTELLLDVIDLGGASDEAYEAGRRHGARRAGAYAAAPSCLEALVAESDRLGFDPDVSELDAGAEEVAALVDFTHCPFSRHVEAHAEIVCRLHQGVVEGFVDHMGDARVAEFCNLAHRTPCRVAITER